LIWTPRPVVLSVAAGTSSAEPGPLQALRQPPMIGRRLVSDEPPGATFASPNGEVAIVNVHDRAGHQDLCRHPSGHERGAVDNENTVCRMRDLEISKVAGPDLADSSACRRDRLLSGCRSDRPNRGRRARPHRPRAWPDSACVFQRFEFGDCYDVFWHVWGLPTGWAVTTKSQMRT
jgi:hypothetical protein